VDKNGGRGRDCRQRKRECGGWAAGETESWVRGIAGTGALVGEGVGQVLEGWLDRDYSSPL
jgi:hypothetical protein